MYTCSCTFVVNHFMSAARYGFIWHIHLIHLILCSIRLLPQKCPGYLILSILEYVVIYWNLMSLLYEPWCCIVTILRFIKYMRIGS